MIRNSGERLQWGIQWREENRLDGKTEHLMWDNGVTPMLFKTRREARNWASTHYGYIKRRPDLRAEPHGWKPARVVRVKVSWRIVK